MNNNWSAIDESVHVDRHVVCGQLIPVNRELGIYLDRSTWFDRYENTGRASKTLRDPIPSGRVANLWVTKLEVDSDPVFFGVRSATIVPYALTDIDDRNRLTDEGAREWLRLATTLRYDRVFVIDLQTPVKGDRKFDLESRIVERSRRSLYEQANHTGVTLRWANLPTHHETFQRELTTDFVDETRRELQNLIQESKWYGDDSKISYLRRELERLTSTDLEPENAYYLPAVVANLAYRIGYLVFFNCRSGKDRSGMVDAEARLLAYQLHVLGHGGEISSGRTAFTYHESLVWTMLVFGEGNLRIQELNSGFRGSKLEPLTEDFKSDPLVRRVGKHRWTAFKGDSAHAHE